MLDVETPALLLYRDVMERNLKTMAGRANKLGVSLRPHIKTHKCLELGRRQLALGAQGITVSTLFEAQAFARGGFTDLTWAFPLDPSHVPHVQRIARDGVFVPERPRDMAYESGGQGLWSTINDYLKFARLFLGEGNSPQYRIKNDVDGHERMVGERELGSR